MSILVYHYAELYCTTNFSFLVGASHPEELAERAAQLGYRALAITDRNSLAGVVRAHTAAKPLGPNRASGPSATSENAISASIDARVPSMSSIGCTSTPGALLGTSSAIVLAGPLANTRNRSAR